MIPRELAERLRRVFGLSGYEAKLYLALLMGAGNPKEASSVSGVPLPRVYDIVRMLESKGLVERVPEGWYAPVPPRAAAVALVARLEEEARRRAREAGELVAELEALASGVPRPLFAAAQGAGGVSALMSQALEGQRVAYATLSISRSGMEAVLPPAARASASLEVLYVLDPEGRGLGGDLGIASVEYCRPPRGAVVADSLASRVAAVFVYEDSLTGSLYGVLVRAAGFARSYYEALRGAWEDCAGGRR